MNTLYDLVTRIDALTANSQQVLNALIRSCVASGSSSGYKVNKYGVPIELDRADIYHLYDFYRSWQDEGFPSGENEFNSLLARADERWRANSGDTSRLATEAVSKHSMILYMTKEQGAALYNANTAVADEIAQNSDFWVTKIRESASPMGTISSAPIPLNLRTPLYDENLSVKSFSQFETYLFPMGYHRADILGTPGNGDDYIAGGKNWTIDVSDFLTLTANHILLGNNTNPSNKLAGYGDKLTTISWGNESYAFGGVSLAFGDHSVAQGDGSLVFGTNCYGMGMNSFIAGGLGNQAVSYNGFATNWNNVAVAHSSFAANRWNYAGGWGYSFNFIGSNDDLVQTDCELTYVESEGVCVSRKTVSEVLGDSSLYKVIRIPASQIQYACMPFDMKAGDMVVIYDLLVKKDGALRPATHIDGYAADPTRTKIVNVSKVSTGDGELDYYYEITLASPVILPNANEVFAGGTVSLYTRVVDMHDIDGNVIGQEMYEIGDSSAVFGHGNAAFGRNQTVVGQMSVPTMDAQFVVGAGSSYIGERPYRSNSLVIGDMYSYMKTANGRNYIGVFTNLQSVNDTFANTERVTFARGTIMRSDAADRKTYAAVETKEEHSLLLAGDNGALVALVGAGSSLAPYFSASYPDAYVSSVLQSLQGTAVIASGSYVSASGESDRLSLVDTLLGESSHIMGGDEHAIALYAEDGIELRSTTASSHSGINIETCSYLTLTFNGLLLNGMTFGSLPTTDVAESFILHNRNGFENSGRLDGVFWGHTTGHSGFYFVDGSLTNAALYYRDAEVSRYRGCNMHLLNSGVYSNADRKYHVASLALPESTVNSTDDTRMRPRVTAGTINGIGGGKLQEAIGDVYSKEIPYMDDVSIWSTAPVSSFGYRMITGTLGETQPHFTDALYPASEAGALTIMPVLRYDGDYDTWGYDSIERLHYFAKILPIQNGSVYDKYHSVMMELYDSTQSNSETPFAVLRLGASLNGNIIDVYGQMRFNYNVDSTVQADGYRIAFVPGFAVTPFAHGAASAIYKHVSSPQNTFVTYLDGAAWSNGLRSGNKNRMDRNMFYGGMVLREGIVVIDIVKTVPSGTVDWTEGGTYTFHVHGPTSFTPSADCIGSGVTESWANAMYECYYGKTLCALNTLNRLMKGEGQS